MIHNTHCIWWQLDTGPYLFGSEYKRKSARRCHLFLKTIAFTSLSSHDFSTICTDNPCRKQEIAHDRPPVSKMSKNFLNSKMVHSSPNPPPIINTLKGLGVDWTSFQAMKISRVVLKTFKFDSPSSSRSRKKQIMIYSVLWDEAKAMLALTSGVYEYYRERLRFLSLQYTALHTCNTPFNYE